MRTAIGGKENSMKKQVNQSKKVEEVTRNYEHPYFVRIEDGDEASIKYYKGQDVPVAHIAFNGCKKHYYAIFNAETQEKADFMNRTYSNWARKDERDKKARQEFELSYEDLAEEGFDPKDELSNTEEIVAYKVVLDALMNEMDKLEEEKVRLCRMVANKEPQRAVAEELGIPRRTLRDRKDKVLSELADNLKDFR